MMGVALAILGVVSALATFLGLLLFTDWREQRRHRLRAEAIALDVLRREDERRRRATLIDRKRRSWKQGLR